MATGSGSSSRGFWRPKAEPVVWPGAFDLCAGRRGTPIGVWLKAEPVDPVVSIVVVDVTGRLVLLERVVASLVSDSPVPAGQRAAAAAARWCLARHLRFFHSRVDLDAQLQSGRVVGWVHGMMVEQRGFESSRVPAHAFSEWSDLSEEYRDSLLNRPDFRSEGF